MATLKHKKKDPRTTPTQIPSPASVTYDPKDWQCLSLIALLVLVFFRDILLGNAFLWEDFLYQWYPFRVFAATSLSGGEIPLWNPYTFNGMPFLADIQTQVFYLPLTALTLFARNGQLSVYWLEVVNILHYVLAGAGMFYLAKSFKLKQLPSLFAGVAFSLSGFMIVHAIHQVMITLVAWYPLILLFFRKSLAGENWNSVFITALLLGLSFLAGFPQLSLFLYFFLFVFFLFELLTTFGFRQLTSRPALMMSARALCVVGLSVGLIMVQLLPTMELSKLSVRAEISFEKATEGSMAWRQLPTLMFPKLFGTSDANGFNYWGPGTYWYYWETCMYMGLLPLLLTILSIRLWKHNKYVVFFSCFGLFSILFALGGNFIIQKFFFFYVPGFSTFRNPSRMVVFLALGGALISTIVLNHLLYDRRNLGGMTKVLFATCGAGALLWILVLSGWLTDPLEPSSKAAVSSSIRTHANIFFFMFLCAGLVLYALISRGRQLWWMIVVAVALLYIDLNVFGSDQNNSKTNPEEYFKRAEPIVRFLQQQDEIFRVDARNGDGLVMDRNQGMVDRIFMMEGYTPLILQRRDLPAPTGDAQFDLLNVKYETVTDREQGRLKLEPRPTYLPRAHMIYRVHVAKTQEELIDSLKSPAFDYRSAALIEKDPPFVIQQQASIPSRTVEITEYRINSISLMVETNSDGMLLVSEMHYPGWNAYVDGEKTEVYRADYNLRGVFVHAGKHNVVMRFEPESFARGGMITVVSLLICVGGIFGSRVLAKRKALVSSDNEGG